MGVFTGEITAGRGGGDGGGGATASGTATSASTTGVDEAVTVNPKLLDMAAAGWATKALAKAVTASAAAVSDGLAP